MKYFKIEFKKNIWDITYYCFKNEITWSRLFFSDEWELDYKSYNMRVPFPTKRKWKSTNFIKNNWFGITEEKAKEIWLI